MIYVFTDEATGEEVELLMSMEEAPQLGAVIEHEGRTLRRNVTAATGSGREEINFVSRQLPRWDKHHGEAGGKFDRRGRPVFTSRQQAKEYGARTEGLTTYGELD